MQFNYSDGNLLCVFKVAYIATCHQKWM